MSSNGSGKRRYNRVRNITSRQAQRDHEQLARSAEHDSGLKPHTRSKNWDGCAMCLRRMRTMGIYVDGNPV